MSDNEMLKLFPLQYQDGPDYCEVKDANGASFALTMRPDVMKAMESALRAAAASAEPVAVRLEARPTDNSQEWVEIFPVQLEWVAKAGHQVRAIEGTHPAPDAEIVAALEEIASWKNDTLGPRPKERGPYDCAPEITEAFDRGARMALYRCADRASAALAKAKGGSQPEKLIPAQPTREETIEEVAKYLESCGFRYSQGFDIIERVRELALRKEQR